MAGELDERALKARKQAAQAVELRIGGKSFQQIADALEYSTATAARRAVLRGMALLGPSPKAEQLRKMELERLERLWAAYYPLLAKLQDDTERIGSHELVTGEPPPEFDIASALNLGALLLKISEARRKLCGLDTDWLGGKNQGTPVTDLSDDRLMQIAGGANAPPT